jgi:tetratricopeptide (TPR) repeat protein
LLCSCASNSKTGITDAKTAEEQKAEINMAAELAKIDTMLKADTPDVKIAHESFLRALDMMEADKIIFAELFYKRALAHDPSSHFLLGELIKNLLGQHKINEAFPLLKLAAQSPKATGNDFLYLARIYKESRILDSAELYYKKASDKMNDNLAVLYEYGHLLDFLKDREFERSNQEYSPEFKRICRELKRIYDILLPELDYPQLLLDRQLFLYHVTETPDSVVLVLLGDAFKANGIEYAMYGFWQAEILGALKRYNEANEILLTIFFMHPSEEFTSKVALRIANIYELMDSVTVAAVWYEQILARDPKSHIAMNNFGYMLIDRDIDVKKGLALVEKALSHSEELSYLDSKAWGLYKIGKYEEALAIFEKLEASGMDERELWLHLAKVCEALKLHDRAKRYMERVK